MQGKWQVTSRCINGEYRYAVYRLRNVNDVDHSGNREYHGGYTPDESEKLRDEIDEIVNDICEVIFGIAESIRRSGHCPGCEKT